MSRRAYIEFMILLITLGLLFLGIPGALAYLQDSQPKLYDQCWTALVIALAVDAVVMLVLCFGVGPKAIAAEWMFTREKLKKRSIPFLTSQWPAMETDRLMLGMMQGLEADGFTLHHGIDLGNGLIGSIAYKWKLHFLFDYIGQHVLFVRLPDFSREAVADVHMAFYRHIDATTKKRKLLQQTYCIALCVFTSSIGQEAAADVLDMFDFQTKFLVAAYDLDINRVYFMNGSEKHWSRFGQLQALVRKHIVGETDENGPISEETSRKQHIHTIQ